MDKIKKEQKRKEKTHIKKLHYLRQRMLVGLPVNKIRATCQSIKEMQIRMGRKLTHNEFIKLISDLKYGRI